MRKTVIALVALGLVVASSAFAANAVRISQVYGGGGSSTGTYKYDYIELFNSSGTPVDIGGWSIQYASATGSFGTATYSYTVFPAGTTIPACGYFLIQSGSAGSGGADLPTPDAVLYAYVSSSAGKVALMPDATVGFTCSVTPPAAAVDFVGFGSTATCYEGAGPAPYSGGAVVVTARKLGGMTDTDVNSADFEVLTSWTVHNSASPTNPECTVVPAVSETWGRVKTLYR
jgi:hypothetical protein